ncbi:MAG: chorismate synthase [Ignavibacteriaceae bacterium]|nr:chorismate synthase [Ignavibacteriaceae bacterium]
MIRFLTAGESHGKALVTIVEGFPSNIPISAGEINYQLKRRQGGYGRGTRMKIESDSVQILSGIRFGKTLGSPISFLIENKDWVNWEKELSVQQNKESIKKITIPRPGHADLVGVSKYNFDDIRNSETRLSAQVPEKLQQGWQQGQLQEYFLSILELK